MFCCLSHPTFIHLLVLFVDTDFFYQQMCCVFAVDSSGHVIAIFLCGIFLCMMKTGVTLPCAYSAKVIRWLPGCWSVVAKVHRVVLTMLLCLFWSVLMMDSYLPKSHLYDILASRYGTDFLCPSKSVPTLEKFIWQKRLPLDLWCIKAPVILEKLKEN